jgi:alpha-D-xyloside xylohydrolase
MQRASHIAACFLTLLTSSFAGLSISVTPVGKGVFRVDVVPATSTNSALQLERDGKVFWTGQIQPLSSYGRSQVPGIEISWPASDEAIYGLGQRFNSFNQSGKKCEMWIRDEPGQSGGEASYFCTPVLFSTRGYALFAADNPEGDFDFNSSGDGQNRYRRAGQAATLYVAAGDSLKQLVAARARIQGPFNGIPDWAWGPWISRNSYENQDEAEAAIRGMIERNIPVAAIVQEAWKGTSETGDFNNFNTNKWPRLDEYFKLCADHGIKTILWQVPVIHPSSPEYATAAEAGYFVKAPDGSVRLRKHWLEGFANVDFTNPKAVAWWKDLLRPVVRKGVYGFKVDDGEDIEPDDVFSDGRRGWQLHNEYSVPYAKAVASLFREENVSSVLWTRSGSLGIERTPALWAGDQYAKWEQLRSLVPAGLSASISGAPFWGHDIGGYIGTPSPELYIRWAQFGAFCPLMQYHGQTAREPWNFGEEAEAAYTLLAKLRMKLKPVLIALGKEAAKTGMPIMRPMILEFPDDARFLNEDSQYMLGPDLLVAPVLEPGTKRMIKFPKGTWIHPLDKRVFKGPADIEVEISLRSAPVFTRKGATVFKGL